MLYNESDTSFTNIFRFGFLLGGQIEYYVLEKGLQNIFMFQKVSLGYAYSLFILYLIAIIYIKKTIQIVINYFLIFRSTVKNLKHISKLFCSSHVLR